MARRLLDPVGKQKRLFCQGASVGVVGLVLEEDMRFLHGEGERGMCLLLSLWWCSVM